MAGASTTLLLMLVVLCWVHRAAAGSQDGEKEGRGLIRQLRRANTPARLLALLAPNDRWLCSEDVLQQLDDPGDDSSSTQDDLENLRAVCNATKTEFTRGFPMVGGRALEPASDVSARVVRVMQRLFKKAIPRSRCKPRVAVVPLQTASTQHYYLPSCVSVKRCSGCCDLEVLSCKPVATRTVKKQVIVIDVVSSVGASLKTVKPVQVEEHIKCKCSL